MCLCVHNVYITYIHTYIYLHTHTPLKYMYKLKGVLRIMPRAAAQVTTAPRFFNSLSLILLPSVTATPFLLESKSNLVTLVL